MKKKIFTLLTLLLCVCSGAWGADIFTATCIASSDANVTANTTNQELTSSQATITGGRMYVSNGDSSDKPFLKSSQGESGNKKACFAIGATKTTYKIVLNSALQAGDKINFIVYTTSSNTNTMGLKLNGSVTMEGTADPHAWVAPSTYTVVENDGLCGQTDVVLTRSLGYGCYFTNFTISREATATITTNKSSANLTATESGVAVNNVISVSGENLTKSGTLNLSFSPSVTGLSVSPTNISIDEDGAISATNVTVSYSSTSNVKAGSTTLTLSDGTTSKEIEVTYSATITPWTLQSISESTTWTFNDSNIPTTNNASLGDSNEHVYANISGLDFAPTFDATALSIKGSYPYYSSGSQHIAQGSQWKFNTTVRGKVTVSYSTADSGGSTRYIKIGGTAAGSTGSTPVTTDAIAVGNGSAIDVEIKSYSDEECQNSAYINVTQIVFTATPYSVTYNGNGNNSGDVPTDANYYASGESVTVLGNTGSLTKEGKIFNGWNTAADGSGTSYATGATFDISDNVTLYAQWLEPAIVTLPTETRVGYIVTKTADGTDAETTTVNRSQSPMHQKKVYVVPQDGSITLTIPETTSISKIVVSGNSSHNNTGSTVTITGANNESENKVFGHRDEATQTITFVPTTQTTTYTISSSVKPSWVIISVYGIEAPTQTITTNKGGWTSYTPVKNATLSEGASAYIVTDVTSSTVSATKVTTMKAGEGYFIKGATGSYTATFTDADADATTGNKVVGCLVPTTIDGSTPNSNSKFILGTNTETNEAGLFSVDSEITIPAGKAYLDADEVLAARQLSFTFDDEETTGISNVDITKPEVKDNVYYNLNGQRVANPSKGLFIVNGKKVIIK